MSRCLCDRSIDHVVLERGEVAHTWRTERWDSLRLLTPNWQSRLPGFGYNGDDPDGYRTVAEVIEFIASYAKAFSAPVLAHTTVTSVSSTETGYLVRTDQGDWLCRHQPQLRQESGRRQADHVLQRTESVQPGSAPGGVLSEHGRPGEQ